MSTSSPQPGQVISHYQIVRAIGKGGMGEVYLAEDSKLDRKVAIKFLPFESTADEKAKSRLFREARAAAKLEHPNICAIYEVGEEDGCSFIVMQYVEGETLASRTDRNPLGLKESLDIGLQVADALSEAHSHGIIHRDIKPANIMITPRGQVKVLDFGLAKMAPEPSLIDSVAETESLLSAPGLVVGTVPYMSPEQVRGERLDGRSDIFSAGAVFYEAMTGRQAFTGENAASTLSAILTREPLPLMRFVTDAPQELQRIVSKALRKDREERYQTAKDLLVDLKTLREELEFHSKLEASGQPNARSEGAPVASAKIITEQRTHSEPAQLCSERVTAQVQIFGQRENHFEADAATEDGKIRGKLLNSRRWLTVSVVAALVTAAVVYALYFHRGFATRPPEIKSLAVLPPRPLQPTVRDEALEMGTASALITRIGSLRQLIVRPESAIEIYARPDQDPLAAGREQKVDAVLDSRYQRSGEKVRFTLRLLRVADGATLWSDTLDQQAADLFAIEDALSGKVTGALRLTLSSAEKELLAKRYTNSAEAWQLYVRGRHLLHQRRIPDVEKAITYFEQAIDLDQEFALAHVMLGVSYTSLNWLGLFPAKEVMPKAKAAYDQALKVDDQLAEAHNYLAVYKDTYERDFKGAGQEYKLAIDLNPNSADVRHSYAFHLTYMGRFDQAIPEIKRAEELDPTSVWISRNVTQILYFARRYDEAIEQARRVVDANPNSAIAYDWVDLAYLMKGDEQGALAASLKQMEVGGAGPDEIAGMNAAFATGGFKGCVRRELDRLLEREKSGHINNGNIAVLYAMLGEKEQALARLQKAVEDRELNVVALKVEPRWDSYRSDPRFQNLLRRIGLAP